MAIEDAFINIRHDAGGSKGIQVPRSGLIVLQTDGTAEDLSEANPLPTVDAGSALSAALLGKMYPTDDVANADDTAGNGAWAEITLAAGTIYVDVSFAGQCRLDAGNTTPAGAVGNIYQPGITYRKATPFAKLWAYGIGAAHAVYSTSATRA